MKINLKENERIDDLEYKGLKIIQNKEEFCFGIDSILLSDFAKEIKPDSKVIDMGTGTGIISILLCGKTKLKHILGIDIQSNMCEMARRSVKLNDLEEKIEIINEDIKRLDKTLEQNSFDAIVTNPPYMKLEAGIKNERESKYISRHEVLCNIEDIARVAYKLLKDGASIYMVHRTERLVDIMYYLRKYKLEPKILRFIQPKEDTAANLLLIRATKNGGEFLKTEKPLVVYKDNGEYTDEILEIYNKK